MRKYVPKDNVQKKAYYTDRFHVVPRVPRTEVEGEHFTTVLSTLGDKVKEVIYRNRTTGCTDRPNR